MTILQEWWHFIELITWVGDKVSGFLVSQHEKCLTLMKKRGFEPRIGAALCPWARQVILCLVLVQPRKTQNRELLRSQLICIKIIFHYACKYMLITGKKILFYLVSWQNDTWKKIHGWKFENFQNSILSRLPSRQSAS